MNMRDQIAMIALPAIIAGEPGRISSSDDRIEESARLAYVYADALIAARTSVKPPARKPARKKGR